MTMKMKNTLKCVGRKIPAALMFNQSEQIYTLMPFYEDADRAEPGSCQRRRRDKIRADQGVCEISILHTSLTGQGLDYADYILHQ